MGSGSPGSRRVVPGLLMPATVSLGQGGGRNAEKRCRLDGGGSVPTGSSSMGVVVSFFPGSGSSRGGDQRRLLGGGRATARSTHALCACSRGMCGVCVCGLWCPRMHGDGGEGQGRAFGQGARACSRGVRARHDRDVAAWTRPRHDSGSGRTRPGQRRGQGCIGSRDTRIHARDGRCSGKVQRHGLPARAR